MSLNSFLQFPAYNFENIYTSHIQSGLGGKVNIGTVYLVQYIFENSTVNINALRN
jgi:hypothetical protein